jgi:type I restriction enzyme S subunit
MAYNEVKLSDVAEYISRGITPSYTEETGTIVINQKCVRGGEVSLEESRYHDAAKKKVPAEKILRKWDILVNSTGTGTLGRVGQIVCDMPQATVDSHVTIVRPAGSIDPAYLGYALKWRQPYIEALAEGSTGQTELSRFRLGDESGVVEVVYGVLYWNGLIETDGFNTAMYAWCVAIMAFNLALRE